MDHIWLSPGTGHDSSYENSYSFGTRVHRHVHLPAGMGYDPRFGLDLEEYVAVFGPAFQRDMAVYGAIPSLNAQNQRQHERSGRHQQRAAQHHDDTETSVSGSGFGPDSTNVPEDDRVRQNPGWWQMWPGITSDQVDEVCDYLNGFASTSYRQWPMAALWKGPRFPEDDALACVYDLHANWQSLALAKDRKARVSAASAAHTQQQEPTAAEAGLSGASSEGSSTAVASPSVTSAGLATPESRVATLVDGNDSDSDAVNSQ